MQTITGEIAADVIRAVVDADGLPGPPSASPWWTTPAPWWPSSG